MALERPKEHAVRQLVELLLHGTFRPGDALPSERELAERIGVTRPTLREALQRLQSEGWITIAQGKSTVVNDHAQRGGLGILASIAQYSDRIPGDMVRGLLQIRRLLMPTAAEAAAGQAPAVLLDHLSRAANLDDAASFTRFDRRLQRLFVESSGNPIMPLMLNDFATLYETVGSWYFSFADIREETRLYYQRLTRAVRSGRRIREVVEAAMSRSEELITTRMEMS